MATAASVPSCHRMLPALPMWGKPKPSVEGSSSIWEDLQQSNKLDRDLSQPGQKNGATAGVLLSGPSGRGWAETRWHWG